MSLGATTSWTCAVASERGEALSHGGCRGRRVRVPYSSGGQTWTSQVNERAAAEPRMSIERVLRLGSSRCAHLCNERASEDATDVTLICARDRRLAHSANAV